MELNSCVRRVLVFSTLTGLAALVSACPAKPDPKVPTKEFLESLKVCGECAAQPNAGWCGPTTGTVGRCLASVEDGRPKPADCREEWFTMPSDPANSAAPYCPALTLDTNDRGGSQRGDDQ